MTHWMLASHVQQGRGPIEAFHRGLLHILGEG